VSKFFIYQDGVRAGFLQNYSSVQWLEAYADAGEARIIARSTAENRELLRLGAKLYNTDSNTAATIVQTDSSDDEQLVVKALIGSAILDERVVMGAVQIHNAEQGMYDLVRTNLRGLPLARADPLGFTETVETAIAWESVLEALKLIASLSDLGFKVRFDPETTQETFAVYKGRDRTKRTADYIGPFSTKLGNIASFSMRQGVHGYKNVAIVDGGDQVTEIVTMGAPSEAERRELYIDASNLRLEVGVDQRSALIARGREVLAEHLKTFRIACELSEIGMKFGRDFSLGDKLPITIAEHGLVMTARVAAVRYIYEPSGRRVVLSIDHLKAESEE